MGLNFRLSQMLFLLVAVPLAFQLILVGTSMSLSTSPEAARQYEGVLLTGVLLNVAVSVAVAFYFSNTLKRRIAAVKDNINRLSSGEQLPPKLRGIDEIAELDEALHQVASQVTRK